MLYDNIKDIAARKGVSISKLEKDLGFARSSISKFNQSKPGIEKIQMIAEYLDVPVDYLLTGEVKSGYYLDDETAKIAQEIFDSKELGYLFDAAKGSTPQDLKMAADFLRRLKGEV